MRQPGRKPDRTDPARRGLVRLAYVSVATRPAAAADLDRIERQAKERNAASAITGFLLAQHPFFFAIMEGPAGPLLARMEAIVTDPLHQSLRVLCEKPIGSRRFSSWGMFRLPTLHRVAGMREPGLHFMLDLAERLGGSRSTSPDRH